MYKLSFEEAEEPEIKLPTSAGSEKAREFQKNIYFCFTDYTKAFDCVDQNQLWEILKRNGATRPSYLLPEKPVCRSRSNRNGQRTRDWFKIGKAMYCHPAYLTYTQKAGLDESQTRIKTARRNINNLKQADDTTLMAESEETLKSFLMRMKEESEKAGLKLNI